MKAPTATGIGAGPHRPAPGGVPDPARNREQATPSRAPDDSRASLPGPRSGTPGTGHFNVAGSLDVLGYAYLGAILIALGAVAGLVYLLSTPSGPSRILLDCVSAAAIPFSVIFAITGKRLIGTPSEKLFFYGFSVFTLALIIAVAAVDGGDRSSLTWLLVLPVVYTSISYPLVAVGWNALASQAGVVFLMAVGHSWGGADWYRFMYVGVFNVIALVSAKNRHTHQAAELDFSIQASHDALTGCLSHGAFLSKLESECRRASRYGGRFTLLMADVDHFKAINDTCGHQVGDETLRAVGAALTGQARAHDEVGRLGGDEFGILLVESDAAHATAFADRVRQELHATSVGTRCTLSVGVTAWSGPADAADDMVGRADAALYKAKAQGRDRVVAS